MATVTSNIDSLIKALSTTSTTNIDALIQLLDVTNTTNLDALIQKLSNIDTVDIDAIIKALATTSTANIDARLVNYITFTFSLDAILSWVGRIGGLINLGVFPLGDITSATEDGLINNVTYNFFEPNKGASSSPVHTNLQTRFASKIISTRKVGEPYLVIKYDYSNIFASEYKQIKHFIDSKEGAVTSFYVIDLSQGVVPTTISTSGAYWTSSIANTRLYSAILDMKSNYVFFNNGVNWKIGAVMTVTTNTSVRADVDTVNLGTLSDSDGAIVTGNKRTFMYPIYRCYLNQGALQNFKPSGFWPNNDSNRGPLYSGSISFTSKYKI